MRRIGQVSILVLALSGSGLAQEGAGTAPTEDAALRKFGEALAFLRNRSGRDYAISSPHGIDEGKYVEVGGIPQWITIRGEDRSHPVLLLLHGGPGDATNPWGYAVLRSWRRHFPVVEWD